VSDGQDPGPLRALEKALAECARAAPGLRHSSPGARATARRIAGAGRRPLVLRFAGGADSLALVDLGDAVSLPEQFVDAVIPR
jgi:hypothetical protein